VAGGASISAIDTASNTVVGSIPGFGLDDVAVTPEGTTAYATLNGGRFSGTAVVIDTATNAVTGSIPVGSAPEGVAITPDQAPVAHLSVSVAPAGSTTTFDASASAVAYGTIAKYAWNFGDGSRATTTTPTTTHVYVLSGTFTATVTETSSGGTSTTKVLTGQTMSRNGGSTARATASVSVVGAAGLLAALQHSVIGVGPGTSLYHKLAQAQSNLAENHKNAACSTLNAFIQEVNAQSGRSIARPAATSLVASGNQIRAVIGC
jgi:YVTN family beta-propeller protein